MPKDSSEQRVNAITIHSFRDMISLAIYEGKILVDFTLVKKVLRRAEELFCNQPLTE